MQSVIKFGAVLSFARKLGATTLASGPGQCSVFYRDDEVLGGGWISN